MKMLSFIIYYFIFEFIMCMYMYVWVYMYICMYIYTYIFIKLKNKIINNKTIIFSISYKLTLERNYITLLFLIISLLFLPKNDCFLNMH